MPGSARHLAGLALGCLAMFAAIVGCDGVSGPGGLVGLARIGPEGGSVALGSEIRVEIPAGALSEAVTIRIERVATPAALTATGAIGQSYRVSPDDPASLTAAMEVSIAVPTEVRDGTPLNQVTLLRLDPGPTVGLGPVELASISSSGDRVAGASAAFGTFSAATGSPNAVPVVSAGDDLTVSVGQPVSLTATATDPDGDELAFAWRFLERPSGSAAALNDFTGSSVEFVADVEGEYRIELVADDGNGGTAADTVRVTAVESQSLSADAGPDASATVGETVTLDGRGSTGTALTFTWRFVSTPGATPSISGAGQAVATFNPNVTGTYRAELTVSDGGVSDRDTVAIAVADAGSPSVVIDAPRAVFLGETVTARAIASDPEDDPLIFGWTLDAPAGSGATLAVSAASATFTPDLPGAYIVRLSVSDGDNVVGVDATVFGNPRVAGTYDTTFRTVTVSSGCSGFVSPGETMQTMDVTQSAPSAVTLRLSELSPNIRSDPTGTLLGTGFTYNGPVLIGNDGGQVNAQGSISGTIDGTILDLVFTFNVAIASCRVSGEIEGVRQ